MKLACAAVVALGSFASFSAAPVFTQSSVIDIGTLGLGSSVLWAVNDHDEAVGWSEIVGPDTEHAILWRDGQLIDLGLLPGDTISRANDINARGQIVGISADLNLARGHAVLWDKGEPIDLSLPNETCAAAAINDHGVIVGHCSVPMIWRGRTPAPLAALPGTRFGGALDLNDAGVIVGLLRNAEGREQPVRWRRGTPEALPLPPQATGGSAEAINARGQIAGHVITPDGREPVLWDRDGVVPLAGAWGAFFGFAWGINNRGDVAVHAFTSPNSEFGAYVWRAGVFQRLEPLGSVKDINERGTAVGRLFLADQVEHGAVWPKASIRIPVPGGVG